MEARGVAYPQPQPYYQPQQSHTERNIILAVIIIVVVIVAAVAVVGSLYFFAVVNRSAVLPQSTNIVHGLITVQAGGYNYYEFTVPATATNAYVAGSFYASGGTGNDITVYVMTRTDFVNWSNGHQFSYYYYSGKLTTGNINTSLPAGDTYDLVYSNMNSLFTSKNVQTTVNLFYTM